MFPIVIVKISRMKAKNPFERGLWTSLLNDAPLNIAKEVPVGIARFLLLLRLGKRNVELDWMKKQSIEIHDLFFIDRLWS
jgi:hypothetical protein